MPITLNGDTGIQTPMYNGAIASNVVTPSVNMKNRIINGDMTIDQRNAGASVTISSNAAYTYTLDRFFAYGSATSKFSVQRNAGAVTPPVNFTNYLGVTSLSAYAVSGGEQFIVGQAIEGLNVSDLAWGTASASAVTLSFRVYSSLTGTFGGAISNSAQNRSYPFSYSVPAANTWTTISVTVAGDTSGTWLTTNGVGVYVFFGLGVGPSSSGTAGAWSAGQLVSATGATSVVGTNGATFYITGVQLEVGSNATSFDYLPYGTELALCQRYFWRTTGTSGTGYAAIGAGGFVTTTNFSAFIPYPVQMRATPTFSIASDLYITVIGFPAVTGISGNYGNQYSARVEFTTSTSVGGYGGAVALENTTASFINASAEL